MALFHRSPGDWIQVHGSPGTDVVSSTSLALVARSFASEGTMRRWELNLDNRIYVIWDAQACCQCEVSGWRCPCKLISPQSRENYAPLTARCRQVFACLVPHIILVEDPQLLLRNIQLCAAISRGVRCGVHTCIWLLFCPFVPASPDFGLLGSGGLRAAGASRTHNVCRS